jgi:hypothetical protein
VKVFDGHEVGTEDLSIEFSGDNPRAIIELLTRMIFPQTNSLDPVSEITIDEATIESWLEIFNRLKEWKDKGHFMKVYRPRLVAALPKY